MPILTGCGRRVRCFIQHVLGKHGVSVRFLITKVLPVTDADYPARGN